MASSFRPDGTPKYATCWLALSAAHCDNSCLYIIPKYLDPGYLKDEATPTDAPSSSSAAQRTKRERKNDSNKSKKCEKSERSETDNGDDYDPLAAALSNKASYQHIRALPLPAGGLVIFTHRLMHWGSKGRTTYRGEPRISLSVAFSDPIFEAPYFTAAEKQRPSFQTR